MSQQNPYLAPQSPLSGGGVPMANSALPREMLVVADGMKFILWGIIITVIGVIVTMVMGASAVGAAMDQGANRINQNNIDEVLAGGADNALSGLRTSIIVGTVIGFIANLVSLLGMYKCSQIPEQSGAKQLGQYAFYGSAAMLAIGLITNFMTFKSGPSTTLNVINLVSAIVGLITLFLFLSYLKKTSAYLGDALAIERSGKLMTLAMIVGGCYLIMALIGLVMAGGNVNAQGGLGGGMLVMILGLVVLVCGIWAFFVYLGTLGRIRTVIEAGTR